MCHGPNNVAEVMRKIALEDGLDDLGATTVDDLSRMPGGFNKVSEGDEIRKKGRYH
jgi:hypothetical protein